MFLINYFFKYISYNIFSTFIYYQYNKMATEIYALVRVEMEQEPKNSILEELFLREKPTRILLGMRTRKDSPVYATILSKEADCTYSHTIKILNVFKKLGIVDFEKHGRIKTVTLTNNGEDIVSHLQEMLRKFGSIENGTKGTKKGKK